MQVIKLTIDDYKYTVAIPEDHTDIGRLTYRNNRPGIYAVNPKGKQRFFLATRINGQTIYR